VDARTDIFSTGVVLYELFTYNHPFDGENMAATLMKIIHAVPPPLKNFVSDYPPELEAIIFKALAKNREDRYHSADDLALDLSQLQEHLKREIIGKHLQQVTVLLEKPNFSRPRINCCRPCKSTVRTPRQTFFCGKCNNVSQGTN